jgi:serine/threonine-protein kinase
MSEAGRASLPTSLVGTVLGRYRLERLLGEGGMGVVYAARHQDLGKLAAVKILHERYDASEQVRVRFMREGQAVSRIRHPNIVDVYDVGTEQGRVYLVMELLEGEDLRSLLAREGPLSPQRTADLLVPVIAAVAAAHDLGVVHRDLKPDNVFLCAERNAVSPKVLDFGISKVADPEKAASLTGTGTLLGTPYYMSPEQAQTDKNVDARSDQYSLGVILYECVTGRRPIDEPALYQLIQRIVQGDFPAPRQVNPSISAVFEHVVLRSMARVPSERFPTTRALGRALLPLASERTRSNYTEELAHDEHPVQPVLTPPSSELQAGLRTTLGESVHERESSRRPTRPRSATLPVAGGALIVAIAAAVFWKLSAPDPAPLPAESAQKGSAAEPVPPVVPPTPVVTATAPEPPASAASPSPPASASAAVPSASAAARVTPAAPKPGALKHAQRAADRPELAPR